MNQEKLIERDLMRFWENVDRSGGSDGCWPWTGLRTKRGYGRFFRRREERAHRVAYELTFGATDCEALRHICDNPTCCNPRHLLPGTHAENRMDCVEKGRQARGDSHGFRLHPEAVPRGDRSYFGRHPEISHGESNGRSKLTLKKVAEIRRRAIVESRSALAREFGVSNQLVCQIVLCRVWVSV
jgi:hypothetical protein